MISLDNELTVSVGGRMRKIFLQKGFYCDDPPTIGIHRHNYPEVHLIIGGCACFTTDCGEIAVSDGEMLIIPQGIYHGCRSYNQGIKHTAFQVECEVGSIEKIALSKGLTESFFDEISNCVKSDDHGTVASFISLLCSYFCVSSPLEANRITDSGFLIREYFSNHYGADASLSELAGILHLSERQTERLVEACMGRSFKEEISATRMAIAERILKLTDMPMSEVSQYVGYRTYAGFWKAFQKHNLNKQKGKHNDSD